MTFFFSSGYIKCRNANYVAGMDGYFDRWEFAWFSIHIHCSVSFVAYHLRLMHATMIMKVQRNNSDNARNDFTAGIKVHFSIRFIQLLNGILYKTGPFIACIFINCFVGIF